MLSPTEVGNNCQQKVSECYAPKYSRYIIDTNITAPPGEGRGDHVWVGEVVAEDEEAGVPRLVRHDSSLNSIALYRL